MTTDTKTKAVAPEATAEKPARRNWKKDYQDLNTAFITLGQEHFRLDNAFSDLIDETNEFSQVMAGVMYEVVGAMCDLEDEIVANSLFSRKPKKVMGKSADALNRAVVAYNNFVQEILDKYEAANALIEATLEDPADDAEE